MYYYFGHSCFGNCVKGFFVLHMSNAFCFLFFWLHYLEWPPGKIIQLSSYNASMVLTLNNACMAQKRTIAACLPPELSTSSAQSLNLD